MGLETKKQVKTPQNDKVMAENVIFGENGGHFGFWPGALYS